MANVDKSYLKAAEYASNGLPVSTTADQVAQASDIVDAYLQRVEGLLWTPDQNGSPLCMTRKSPESACTLTNPIVAGLSVPVVISGGPTRAPGEALVLNRAGTTNAETCYILSVQDSTHFTLASVVNDHAAGELVESGLVIEQIIRLPKDRSVATVSKGPIVKLVSALGRISYSRRGRSNNRMQDYTMLNAANAFGGAPVWQVMQVTDNSIDRATNQIWCPIGILMVPYSEVKFNYIAGFQDSGLPYQIKQATANIVKAIAESPASAGIKFFKAGETQMTRFLDTVIDADTRNLLAPYMGRSYG